MVEEKYTLKFLISYSKHHKVRVQYENKCGRKPQNIKGLLNMQHECAKWKNSQLLIVYHASFSHKKLFEIIFLNMIQFQRLINELLK